LSGDTPDHELGNIVKKILTTPAENDLAGLIGDLYIKDFHGPKAAFDIDNSFRETKGSVRITINGQYAASISNGNPYYLWYWDNSDIDTLAAEPTIKGGDTILITDDANNVIKSMTVDNDKLCGCTSSEWISITGDLYVKEYKGKKRPAFDIKNEYLTTKGTMKMQVNDQYVASISNGHPYYFYTWSGATSATQAAEYDLKAGDKVVLMIEGSGEIVKTMTVTAEMLK